MTEQSNDRPPPPCVPKLDVQHFMRTLHIKSYEELHKVHYCAMIAWEECIMREIDEAEPSAIGRRLATLSSRRKSIAVRSLRRTFGAR